MKTTYISEQLSVQLANAIRLPNLFVFCWDIGIFTLVSVCVLWLYAQLGDWSQAWTVAAFVAGATLGMVFSGAYRRDVIACPMRRTKRHTLAILLSWCLTATLAPNVGTYDPSAISTLITFVALFFVTNALRPLLIDVLERTGRKGFGRTNPY